MTDYTAVPTRDTQVGALDKAVLMDRIAASLTRDRAFNEFVLRVVSNADNAADSQVAAWFKYVSSRKYRRENGEIYRNWTETIEHGGDCDDLVILLVAGLLSLGIPARTEILTDEQGWGFHDRARCGLPPHDPETWVILDPVWQSEREWVMADRDVLQSPVMALQPQTAGVDPATSPSSSTSSWWIALSLAVGWILGRASRNSHRDS